MLKIEIEKRDGHVWQNEETLDEHQGDFSRLTAHPTVQRFFGKSFFYILSQNERGIDAAETKRVGQDGAKGCFTAMEWRVVEIAGGIGLGEIQRGRDVLIFKSKSGKNGFDRGGGAERMTVISFGAADSDFLRVIAKSEFDGGRFIAIIHGRGTGVSIDIVNLFRRKTGII